MIFSQGSAHSLVVWGDFFVEISDPCTISIPVLISPTSCALEKHQRLEESESCVFF